MSNENVAVVEVIGTTEVVETPQKKAKSPKAARSQKKASGKGSKDTPQNKTKGGKKGKSYKRGSLSAAINAMFDKEGVDEVSYEAAEKLAKSVKPDTKFNRYHLAWYKNNYRNNQP